MKKSLQFLIFLLVSGFILSSCGKSVYITKRKYTKGYYVNHSHKKESVSPGTSSTLKRDIPETKKVILAKKQTPVVNSEKTVVLTANASRSVGSSNSGTHHLIKNKKHGSSILGSSRSQIKLLESIVPNKKVANELKRKFSHDSEALSLLWVIILVILLVYLIALLFDSFGLGWVIHILALVALILLILWLLRLL